MLKCPQCGVVNPLGRVFCDNCGGKLDLSNMTRAQVKQTVKGVSVWTLVGRAAAVLLSVAIVLGVLSLIPSTQPIGAEPFRDGVSKVASPLATMRNLPRGRVVARTFSEADINGYFRYGKARELKFESVSLSIGEGFFVAHIVERLGPWRLGTMEVTPRLSYRLACLPLGTAIRVSKVKMGILPLVGPPKTAVIRKIHRRFAAQPEWESFEHLTAIRATPGVIELEASR